MSDVTSEERLLNVIKNEKGVSKSKRPRPKININRFFNFKAVVWFVLIAGLGYLGYRNYLLVQDGGETENLKALSSTRFNFEEAKIEKVTFQTNHKPFQHYESIFSQKDIFLLPWEVEEPDANMQNDTNLNMPVQDNSLNLVGIVLDDDPQAIIEDLTAQETLFLKINERAGQFRVKDIQEDKVILERAGQTIELTR